MQYYGVHGNIPLASPYAELDFHCNMTVPKRPIDTRKYKLHYDEVLRTVSRPPLYT